MTRRRLLPALTLLAAGGMLLAGCATAPAAGDRPPGSQLGASWPDSPTGEVVGVGLVLDKDGSPELCLGPVAESAPPQCAGIPLDDWSWEGLDGVVEYDGARWGNYAVQGRFDGTRIAVTQPPVPLALYDPMMTEDPTGGRPGAATEAELAELQALVPELLGEGLLGSYPENGRLVVDVLWDDGTWQDAADADFGADRILIRPALKSVG